MPENPAFSESASESWQQLAINVETQARALRGLAEGTPLAAQAADLVRDEATWPARSSVLRPPPRRS